MNVPTQPENRIIDNLDSLFMLSEAIKKEEKTIGYISGCFDIIHIGHINLFRYAKNHVDFLFVGLDNDEYIKKAKGPGRPFFDAPVRLSQLAEIRSIDYVFLLSGDYAPNSNECDFMQASIITKLKPDILFEGQVSNFTHRKIKLAQKFQIQFINCPDSVTYPTSTTSIACAIGKDIW